MYDIFDSGINYKIPDTRYLRVKPERITMKKLVR